jgi:hypothetical protein
MNRRCTFSEEHVGAGPKELGQGMGWPNFSTWAWVALVHFNHWNWLFTWVQGLYILRPNCGSKLCKMEVLIVDPNTDQMGWNQCSGIFLRRSRYYLLLCEIIWQSLNDIYMIFGWYLCDIHVILGWFLDFQPANSLRKFISDNRIQIPTGSFTTIPFLPNSVNHSGYLLHFYLWHLTFYL